MRTLFIFVAIFLAQQITAQSPAKAFDIPIFAYHRFGDDRFPSTNTSVEVFEKQLKYLKENNFEVLGFGEAINNWKSGKNNPEKAVILTIDDGYLSFYENGWPLLKKFGYPATIFIQTETIGGNDFMSWDQIREIRDAGIEIGNHSHSHAYFLNMPENERNEAFRKDVEKATQLYNQHLDEAPEIFAYPFGEYTADMEEILASMNFRAAAVQQSGVFSEQSDPFAIPRFPMGGPFGTLNGFINKSTMKALHVSGTNPSTPFFSKNPPTLKIEIVPGHVNIQNCQFFLQGDKMKISRIEADQDTPFVILESDRKLTARRTLYTLTAPSVDGKSWHWFSYLWVNPEVSE